MTADAFMIFQLGQISGRAPERVLEVYRNSRSKGWGNMAKRLGIKPGSAEFNALKNGNLYFNGKPAERHHDNDDKRGHNKGRGRGHNK